MSNTPLTPAGIVRLNDELGRMPGNDHNDEPHYSSNQVARIVAEHVAANAKLIAAAPDLLAAIEAMRVAGGAAEFQAAFDRAKKLALMHN